MAVEKIVDRCYRWFPAALVILLADPTWGRPLILDPAAQRISIEDRRITVNGLAWFSENKPGLWRLPFRLKDSVRPIVWTLAQDPSGARIRFVTDATEIGLSAEGSAKTPSANMSATAYAGVDLYGDDRYVGSAAPDRQGKIEKLWIVGKSPRLREITIYLPLYQPLIVNHIELPPEARLGRPRPFAMSKPIVYYGSSITQGAAASNPGLAYEALLGRWLNLDFINLGFSGNGLGEPELARAVAEIDAACFVVDYWANPSAESYRQTLPRFVETVRRKHPQTPIIVTSPYFNPSEDQPGEAGEGQIVKRAFAREFVRMRRSSGDSLIFHVDGLEMLSREQADGLADGRHANSMGFYFCAKGLEPHLRKILNLSSRAPPEP